MQRTLTLWSYQIQADTCAIYPMRGSNLYYPALGLAGEAGEVCNKIKKIMRDKEGKMESADIMALRDELGDVLWYVAALCSELRLDMGAVAEANLDKLFSRKDRGKLGGSGDTR